MCSKVNALNSMIPSLSALFWTNATMPTNLTSGLIWAL
jgi:hypothetical protein